MCWGAQIIPRLFVIFQTFGHLKNRTALLAPLRVQAPTIAIMRVDALDSSRSLLAPLCLLKPKFLSTLSHVSVHAVQPVKFIVRMKNMSSHGLFSVIRISAFHSVN
ncbi:hypothetical protein D3C73_1226160 [compost metagenome]